MLFWIKCADVARSNLTFCFLGWLKYGAILSTEWRGNTSRFFFMWDLITRSLSMSSKRGQRMLPLSQFSEYTSKQSTSILMNSVVSISCKPNIREGCASIKLDSLDSILTRETWGWRNWVEACNHQKQDVCGNHGENRAIVLIRRIWHPEIFGISGVLLN